MPSPERRPNQVGPSHLGLDTRSRRFLWGTSLDQPSRERERAVGDMNLAYTRFGHRARVEERCECLGEYNTSTRLHRSPLDTFKYPKATRGDLLQGAGIYDQYLIDICGFPEGYGTKRQIFHKASPLHSSNVLSSFSGSSFSPPRRRADARPGSAREGLPPLFGIFGEVWENEFFFFFGLTRAGRAGGESWAGESFCFH